MELEFGVDYWAQAFLLFYVFIFFLFLVTCGRLS